MAIKNVVNDIHSSDTKRFDEIEDLYDIEKCVKWIKLLSLNKVCLQFPDDLLKHSAKIALSIEKYISKKVYILGDTTCGSCCIDEIAAQHVKADGIIHFGHACLNPTCRLPVLYILPKKKIDIIPICDKIEEIFQDYTKKLILFYDVSYAYLIRSIYDHLKNKFKSLVISKLNCTSNVEFTDNKDDTLTVVLGRTYVLENGCKINDYEAIFLGENEKTLFTLALTLPAKQWYYLQNNNIISFDAWNTSWLKRRRFLVEKLKDAKVVGIVIATLAIKEYLKCVSMVKNILKQNHKKTYMLNVGKINPTKLANFPEIDVFVVITCSENEVFDSREFLKPMLMPYEVELAFNASREFSTQYCLDFRQILPDGINYCDFKPSDSTDVSLISGDIRNSENADHCTDKMDALTLKSPGTVSIGKAGAQYLQNRSWKGVEQRLGVDPARPAELGRSGLPCHYKNEPLVRNNSKKS